MQRNEGLQLELFSQGKDADQSARGVADSSLMARIWRHEKLLLTALFVAVGLIIAFSLGVEKGKRLSYRAPVQQAVVLPAQQAASRGVVMQARTAAVPAQAPVAALKKVPAPVAQTKAASAPLKGYIIQLASYKTKVNAQREAESLRKRGLSPIIFSKGNYSILCVGNIANKETAQSLLPELQKKYKGCYIRRL